MKSNTYFVFFFLSNFSYSHNILKGFIYYYTLHTNAASKLEWFEHVKKKFVLGLQINIALSMKHKVSARQANRQRV